MDLIDVKLRSLRCRLAGILVQEKFEAFVRAFERRYDPNQPRDDRGRWTDGGGGSGGDGGDNRTGSDGGDGGTRDRVTEEPAAGADYDTSDPEARIHLVAGDGSSGYPVDLAEEDARGGHTLRGHAGKTHSYLVRELRERQSYAQKHGDRADGLSVGSFTSEDAANRLVKLNDFTESESG